jgi:hypothetical protein
MKDLGHYDLVDDLNELIHSVWKQKLAIREKLTIILALTDALNCVRFGC